jgi:hypothetical protein
MALTPIDATGMSGATVALLDGGTPFAMVDLWVITLSGGGVVRWHGGPDNTPLTFVSSSAAGGAYVAGPGINRGKITTKLGVDVATLQATFLANSGVLINSAPLLPFVRGNGFDGATVVLYRGYMTAWGQPIIGVTISFSGRVTSIKSLARTQFDLTVSSWTVLLNVSMGPDVFQANCLNQHYDANCTLTPSLISGTVSGGGSVNGCNSNLSQADGFFTKGVLIWVTGPNAGLRRAVQTYLHASGALAFAFPLPAAPGVGDTFTVARGCLLNIPDCTAQGNLIHFRATPFTPPAITGAVGV